MNPTTVIPLEKPLKRGDQEIKSITLHKPNAGQLRGVSLRNALEMQADVICLIVPRISDPKITPQEMNQVEPCDLLSMGAAIANFLLPPSLVAEAESHLLSPTE
ncbi:MAG: phage tail assembly protein [Proteobacteria bacterium]|nr:phage tail assembly protein [Pseudomonadota bacterium]